MEERLPNDASEERDTDLEAKVEELRRVNAELGRELRRGAASRRPRSPAVAARALTRLTSERDAAQEELERAKAKLAAEEHNLEELGLSFEGLRLEAEQLRREVARLRSGRAGFLRRVRARLLRR